MNQDVRFITARVTVQVPGLTDTHFGRIADQCHAISVPDVTDASVDGLDDEITFTAFVQAGSPEEARDKLRSFAASVLDRALSA